MRKPESKKRMPSRNALADKARKKDAELTEEEASKVAGGLEYKLKDTTISS